MEEKREGTPWFTSVKMHIDHKGGYSIWIPGDWHQIKMKKGHQGFVFSPYPNDINTSVVAEKHKLKFKVTDEDWDILRKGFTDGIQALPGVEIESQNEHITSSISFLEARFTFLEGDQRRKRWVRNIYWGDGQLVLVAQGKTVEDFEYWLPMFYNILTTVQIV